MQKLTQFFNLIVSALAALILFSFAGLSLPSCANKPAVPAFNSRDYLENMPLKEDAIIRLHDENGFFCSATVISKKLALTAAHCLRTRDKINVHTSTNKDLGTKARRGNVDERIDLGIIVGDFNNYNVAPVAIGFSSVLDLIYTVPMVVGCGFPQGGPLTCTTLSNSKPYYFQSMAAGVVLPGMSGGPVIDPGSRIVVGVISAMAEHGAIFTPTVEYLTL